jgi:hypothetical protein
MNRIIKEGREVTFILQKGKAVFRDFESWYLPIQNELKSNELCKFMVVIRNSIEKEGTDHVTSHSTKFVNTVVITSDQKLIDSLPAPTFIQSNVIAIGDSEGQMRIQDGTAQRRSDLPGSSMKSDFHFDTKLLPASLHAKNSARELCEEYITLLNSIVERARAELTA